jgi:hypothetical protein
MSTESEIPDAETRARSVRNMKEVSRQLEIVALMLDEAIALADRDLRAQRMARLQKRASLFVDFPNSVVDEAHGNLSGSNI